MYCQFRRIINRDGTSGMWYETQKRISPQTWLGFSNRLNQSDSTANFANPPHSLENIRLFKGSEHLLQFLRLHTVEWMCTFDMAWLVAHSYDLWTPKNLLGCPCRRNHQHHNRYPFDTQTCNMEFTIKNEFSGYAKLTPGLVEYHQAMPENDLYFIQDTRSPKVKAESCSFCQLWRHKKQPFSEGLLCLYW